MCKNSARNRGDATGIRRRGTRSEGSERLRKRRGAQAAAADEAERGGDRARALTWHRMNTPLRTSHEPRRGSFPHTTRFWPHSVQYLIRKPTVVFGMTLISPFRPAQNCANNDNYRALAVPYSPDNTPEPPRVPANPVPSQPRCEPALIGYRFRRSTLRDIPSRTRGGWVSLGKATKKPAESRFFRGEKVPRAPMGFVPRVAKS